MADTAETLDLLAEEFWAWRTVTAPDSSDDLPRLDRPPGWLPDWSAVAIADRRSALDGFYQRHRALESGSEPVAVQVDGRLLGCALDRAHWELDLLCAWQHNPCFYVDQSLAPIYNLLLISTPFTAERAADVVRLLRHVPKVLGQAVEHLADAARAPFAVSALGKLAGVEDRLRSAMAELEPLLPSAEASGLPEATAEAVAALGDYRQWLQDSLPGFRATATVEPRTLAFLLHRIALLPHSAQRLREYARHERIRATGLEAMLHQRHRGASSASPTADTADLVDRQRAAEEWIRRFYVDRGILGQPPTLRHYRFVPCPAYLEPLTWLGVCDDLTSAARVTEDAVRYVARSGEARYFEQAAILDPRTTIVHEGVHAQQFALSWGNPRPARRRFYDSVPNEGIAFYNEELMLVAGAFDDSPTGALFVANAMRLRALRVELDIALALGELTLDEAAHQLATLVPMDTRTARDEAVFFVSHPGQGLSYQTGKLQLQELLADAARRDDFLLLEFHNRIWREGNVPFVLQRWEMFGDRDDLDAADRLAATNGVGNSR
jgi:hypothetical protein